MIISLVNIKTIVKRELYSYFCSPIAYIFIIIFLLVMGIFTFGDNLGSFYDRGVADLEIAFFTWHPWIYMIFVPAIGMRLWSEEINTGTLELLCTSPITLKDAVIAKYIAGAIFLLISIAFTFPYWITVNYLGDPDNLKILSGYIGSFLMAISFLSLSSMTSAMTRNQIVSFIITMIMTLFLILCGFPPIIGMLLEWTPLWFTDFIRSMSIYTHFTAIQRGVIDSRDLIYFISLITLGLVATHNSLRNR
jgi:ABC-2 type transport system permease protein